MTREQEDSMYLRICKVVAMYSHATRAKVGAVIVKDNNILSFGFNGTPSGMDNCCEYVDEEGKTKTKKEVLHAESNALMKLTKTGGFGSSGATMYITLSPCIDCAKLIIQGDIKRVVYMEKYRDDAGIKLLEECGIKVDHMSEFDLVGAYMM